MMAFQDEAISIDQTPCEAQILMQLQVSDVCKLARRILCCCASYCLFIRGSGKVMVWVLLLVVSA